jgi:hypothetical protein
MNKIAAALGLSLFGALAVTPASAVEDQCVFVQTIDGFNVIDDETLIIYTGPRSAYRVNLFGHCMGLRWTETIGIDSRDGRLCWPSNSHIVFFDHGIKSSCPVDSVLKMARPDIDKLKADKKADKPAQ